MKSLFFLLSLIVNLSFAQIITIGEPSENKSNISDSVPIIKSSKNLPSIRFSLSAGYGQRLGEISENIAPQYTDHVKGLRPGGNFNVEFDYYFNDYLGLNLNVGLFLTSNKSRFTIYDNNSKQDISYEIQSNVRINHYGAGATLRIPDSDKERLIFLASFGLIGLNYREHNSIYSFSEVWEGTSYGLNCKGGFDFFISKKYAIGLNVGSIFGSLSEASFNGENKKLDEKLSLSRFDIAAGIRMYP